MSMAHKNSVTYWLTPVRSDQNMTARDIIRVLVGQEKIYAFSQKAASVRTSLKAGDWICFYASAIGIVAHARGSAKPELHEPPKKGYECYPWVVRIDNPHLYIDDPVVIDAALRKRWDAFRNRDPSIRWSWFVQKTRKISEHDFRILSREKGEI